MSDYGISQNQPIQRYNYPVVGKKKENKQENMQKAVTYTLATVASLAVATLVGYGIVNKGGSAKKVVDGAKKGAREVAKDIKPVNPAREDSSVILKTLAKITKGEQVTLKELRETQNVLTKVAKEEASLKSVLLVLTKIINRYEGKKPGENITIDDSLKAELNPLETEVQNSLIKIFATSDFKTYQAKIGFNFDQISLALPEIQNATDHKKHIEAQPIVIKLQELVLIDEDHSIYVKHDYNKKEMDDDTDLYIKDTKGQIYTFKASKLKKIVDIPEVGDIIDSTSIDTFDIAKFEIKQCRQTGSSDNDYYVFGFKAGTDDTKPIKVSKLSADNINLLADDTNELEKIIDCSAIELETVSEVLKKGVRYCDAGTLKEAGSTIMSSICKKIKDADDTQKANIIKQTLSKIQEYDNDSLGKAVVDYFVKNAGIDKPAIWGKVLEENNGKLCPGGELNASGMLIMKAIKEKIENAKEDKESGKTINDVKAQIIVDFLKEINDFNDNSLGNAALEYLVDNDCLNVKIFENVLKAQGKLFVDKDNGKLNKTSKDILSKILCKDPDYDSLNTLVSDLNLTEYTNESLGIKFDSGTLKVIQSKQAFNLAQSNLENPVALMALSKALNPTNANDSKIFENPKKLNTGLDYDEIKTKFKDKGEDYADYTPIETVLYNVDANNDAKYVQSIKDLPVFIKIININGKDKLVKTSDELTTTGTALVEAIKTNIKDENDIATMLNGINDGKFESGEIGQFVVDAIVQKADADTLGKVLNNLKDKLIDTSVTDGNKKLKPLGQVLLKGYANQTLSTMHTKISYSRPDGSTERNRIKTEITINGVRFKFYNKDNEIKYYVGQTR